MKYYYKNLNNALFLIFFSITNIGCCTIFGQTKNTSYIYYNENGNAYIIEGAKKKIFKYQPIANGSASSNSNVNVGNSFELSINDQDYFNITSTINKLISKKSLQKFGKEDWLRSRIEIKVNKKLIKNIYLRTETKEVYQFEKLLRKVIDKYKQ